MKTTKKNANVLIAVRIPRDTHDRLLKRVERGRKAATPTTIAAVVRALLEEHA